MKNIIKLHKVGDRTTRLNVLGEPLDECSCDPMTGWFRDGSCATEDSDQGHHVICCVMDSEFLDFSLEQGNDLSTPRPEWGFPGLKPGDHWCLCAQRWKQALAANKAPKVILQSCHQSALQVVDLRDLREQSLR